MSKYVAIVKLFGEIERNEFNKNYPNDWPAECSPSYETVEEAKMHHPNLEPGRILSVENYALFSKGLQMADQFIPKTLMTDKKPWYKFWG